MNNVNDINAFGQQKTYSLTVFSSSVLRLAADADTVFLPTIVTIILSTSAVAAQRRLTVTYGNVSVVYLMELSASNTYNIAIGQNLAASDIVSGANVYSTRPAPMPKIYAGITLQFTIDNVQAGDTVTSGRGVGTQWLIR